MSMATPPAFPGEEASVHARYTAAAHEPEAALCCPTDYRHEYLDAIPEEIRNRDYGCGDPTPYVRSNETVLDLGSGSGKTCYILSQVVGQHGRVIGVDCNQDMLALARRHRPSVAQRIGYSNVEFRCGMIQDLRLDLERLLEEVARQPQPAGCQLRTPQDWFTLRAIEERLRHEHPLVADASIDCVVSNCVLNLVRPRDRGRLFSEIFRVLKPGGRAAVSDIVADEDPADGDAGERLQRHPDLWSGCIAGAYREDLLLKAFEEAGFHGIQIAKLQPQPWRTVEGIEFRSMTVLAFKGKQGPCLERNQAVIYRGPFRSVEDDDGHKYDRGRRVAVCDKTFRLLQREPYAEAFEPVEPHQPVPHDAADAFDCSRDRYRDPRETKGQDYHVTTEAQGPVCGPNGNCC